MEKSLPQCRRDVASKITGSSLLYSDKFLSIHAVKINIYYILNTYIYLSLAITFAMTEVLYCTKKVSLYPKAFQQPAKTGIKRGKHCYVLPSSGEDQAKVNNLRELSSEVNFSFSSWVVSTLPAN